MTTSHSHLLPGFADNTRTALLAGTFGLLFVLFEKWLYYSPIKAQIRGVLRTNKKLNARQIEKAVVQANARIVGAVHNMIQIPLALYVLVSMWDTRDNALHATSAASELMLAITGGFFIQDTIHCALKLQDEGWLYLVHASVCCAAYTWGLWANKFHWLGAAFLMFEISTPFVHLRWFLYKLNLTNTSLYFWNGVAMIVSFFFCRPVWGTYMSIIFWKLSSVELANQHPGAISPAAIYAYRTGDLILNGLNFYWFYLMANKAIGVLIAGKSLEEVSTDKDE